MRYWGGLSHLWEEAHINITAFSPKTIEGGAEYKKGSVHICPDSPVDLGPEGDLLVHGDEPLLPTVEELNHVLGQPAVLASSLESKLEINRAAEHLSHRSKRVWIWTEALSEGGAGVGEDIGGGKVLVRVAKTSGAGTKTGEGVA